MPIDPVPQLHACATPRLEDEFSPLPPLQCSKASELASVGIRGVRGARYTPASCKIAAILVRVGSEGTMRHRPEAVTCLLLGADEPGARGMARRMWERLAEARGEVMGS